MYTQHFNFKEKPFNLTPDPRFLYLSPGHQEALASMIYGIREKRGFVSIIGEIGIGKTTLLHTLFKELGDEIKTVFIFNTKITFVELLQNILIELNLTPAGDSKTALISQLNDYLIARLAENKTVAIIIDEAQNLSPEVLEELRMLSNLETPKEKLLQIVLVGQPELDFILRSQNLRQLKQRIAINCYLTALNREDQMKYIAHRLTIAGHRGNQVFTPGALELICKHSRGIPRLINIFCDNALLTAYGKELRRVDTDIMEEIINDYEQSKILPAEDKTPPSVDPRGRKFSLAKMMVVTILMLLTLLVAFYLGLSPKHAPGSFGRLVNSVAAKVQLLFPAEYQTAAKESLAKFLRQSLHIPAPVKEENMPPATDEHPPETHPDSGGAHPEQMVHEDTAPPPQVAPAPLTSIPVEEPVKEVRAAKGDMVSALATREYGSLSDTLCDIIKRANPKIEDLNRIYIGDNIILPHLDIERLIIAADDGTFSIHLATFSDYNDARALQQTLADREYQASLHPVTLVDNQVWLRVTLGHFPDRATATAYARSMDLEGSLLPFPVDVIMQSLKAEESIS